MATFTFDTADVAANPALAFGVLSLTVPDDRAAETHDALTTLGFNAREV